MTGLRRFRNTGLSPSYARPIKISCLTGMPKSALEMVRHLQIPFTSTSLTGVRTSSALHTSHRLIYLPWVAAAKHSNIISTMCLRRGAERSRRSVDYAITCLLLTSIKQSLQALHLTVTARVVGSHSSHLTGRYGCTGGATVKHARIKGERGGK